MQQLPSVISMLFSILMPAQIWYTPSQPLNFTVQTNGEVALVLTDFNGKLSEAKMTTTVAGGKEFNAREIFPQLGKPGTYILFAVPKEKRFPEFVGTPVVIEVRSDKRPGAPDEPIVVKTEPLRYVVVTTDLGEMTWVFYYDIAPNTTYAIQTLADQGYYDGLTFHRILPGFVIQGGDPLGSGLGGPGFNLNAEFSDRKHEEGILSMARGGDPLESSTVKPRAEFANTAGSQFFVCLGAVPALDGRYTVFGKVVEGLDTVKAIAAVPIVGDPKLGKPGKPPVIKKMAVKSVTAEKNPYATMLNMAKPVK